MSITAYAGTVDYAPNYVKNKAPWKHWDDLDNLKKADVAYCVRSGNGTIATRSGTYNTPAPIVLSNFKFDIAQGTQIEKVIVHYSHQKFNASRSQANATFPIFSGPQITLMGTGQTKTGNAVPTSYTQNTLEFTGVTAEQVNSDTFGIKFEYPKNNSTNTGRMCLGNVYIELVIKTPTMILSANTANNTPILNETISVNFNVERINTVEYKPSIEIDIPTGLTYKSHTGHGTATLKDGTLSWNSSFDGRTKNTLTVQFTCNTSGTHTLEMHDTLTSASYELKINVSNITLSASTTINNGPNPLKVGETVNYNVVIKTNTKEPVTLDQIIITLPANISLPISTGYIEHSRTYTKIIISRTITGSVTIPLQCTFQQEAIGTETISVKRTSTSAEETLLVTPVLVQDSNMGTLSFTRIRVPEEYTSAMGTGITYRLMTICKHSIDTANVNITDWKNNVRVGIYNSYEAFADEIQGYPEDFMMFVQWATKISTKNWTEYYIDFKYDEEYPLYIIFSHEYNGNAIYDKVHFDFSQPVLVEKQYWGKVDYWKTYPVPVNALCNNTDWGVATLAKRTDTAPVIAYDWNGLAPLKDTDIAIRGITLFLDYTVSKDVELQVTISAEGEKDLRGYRNITLVEGSGTAKLGGRYNLFGLTPHDLRGKAQQLTVELVVNNPYDHDAIIEVRNLKLNINYIEIPDAPYGFSIDGERGEEYGIWFTDMKKYNLGTKNEIEEYHVNGTDKTIVNRMNITPKEIEIEFAIDECELKDALELADDVIAKLFTNRRNIVTNKPYERWIIFDHMPNKRYYWIRKDEIDDEVEDGVYYATVTLYIQRGTAEVIPLVTSGSAGETEGLVSIEPLIHLQSNVNGQLQLHEAFTEQNMLVKSDKIKIGDRITVDNENRRVGITHAGSTDIQIITDDVDFSTTWFKVRGEYQFESSTAIITDVRYHERR